MGSWFEHLKVIALTIALTAIVIAGHALAVVAVPVMLGIGIVLAIYVVLRILNEDID